MPLNENHGQSFESRTNYPDSGAPIDNPYMSLETLAFRLEGYGICCTLAQVRVPELSVKHGQQKRHLGHISSSVIELFRT